MNIKLKKIFQCFVLLLLIGLFTGAGASAATKTVMRVDRYGELYYYSGSPVVTIRSNVSAIHKDAFEYVKTTRFVTSGNPYLKSVNGVLYSKDGTLLIKCPTEKQGSFTVPSTVRKIAACAFEDCTKLTRVTIPDSVTSIGSEAFRNCSLLRSVRLSNYIRVIPESAFYKCSSLVSTNIPATCEKILSGAFNSCQSLKSISLPDSVSQVGYRAFSDCLSLKKARLSKKMKLINPHLFKNCTELKTVENTGSIETIANDAFRNCVNLKTFSYSGKLERIGSHAFQNCIELGTVSLGKGVSSIANNAFNGAASKFIVDSDNPEYSGKNGMLLNEKGTWLIQAPIAMTGKLTIPKGVRSIAAKALAKGAFSSISIPEGVTYISTGQFINCENLVSIELPASLDHIYQTSGNLNLRKLKSITVAKQNGNFHTVGGAVFRKDNSALMFFPHGKKGSFTIPAACKYINRELKFNRLTSVRVSKKSKYYSSKYGILYNKKGKKILALPMNKKSYRLSATVRDIGYINYVKSDLKCRSIKVNSENEKYSSKAGVLFDSDSATLVFYPPEKKGAYTIPTSTSYIAGSAFDDARKLTALTITKNVKRSRYSTFYFRDCASLRKITVKQGQLNYISMDFSGCSRLSTLTFPSTIMTTDLDGLPEGITIRGWKNTYAKESAEKVKGKFVSLGTIPNIISGAKIRKIIDKYQLSWNALGEASGYQVYTSYSTIKDLKGSGSTSCFISDAYKESTIYIRAYKIVNKKKVYGKARAISIY